MNERIKALLLNARNMFVNGVTESDNKIYIHGSEENLEKFAELIVKECACIIDEEALEERNDFAMRRIECCSWMIKEHFGVER
jgi:hypothetical protein